MNRRKKRSFSLIEILISVTLLALLTSSLFYSYRKINFEKKEASHLLKPLLEERYADIKLFRFLSKAQFEQETLFYTQDNHLFFIFDHGAHKEPLLSGSVLGHLYWEKKTETIYLEVRPHPQSGKETPFLTYEILPHVQDLSFNFYYPPTDPKKIVDPKTVGDTIPQIGWQEEWKKGYHVLPTFIKVLVKRPLFFKNRFPLEFTYTVEENNREINYLR